MKRSGFKQKEREGPSTLKEPKPRAKVDPQPKTCAMCPREFFPRSSMHTVCSQRCAMKKQKVDKAAVLAKEKADLVARKEAVKTIADRIAEAQKEFNAYIRLRDAHKGCIDCAKPFEPQKPGGSIDAGHYLARGSATAHRFNEDNCFAQRKNCNRPGGATRAAFRAGVLARIGPERLEALENDYAVHKWTHEELIEIRATYKRKAKELKERQA